MRNPMKKPPLIRSPTEVLSETVDLPTVCLTCPSEEGYLSFPIDLYECDTHALNSTDNSSERSLSNSSSLITSNSSSTTDCSSITSTAELSSSISSSLLLSNQQDSVNNAFVASQNNMLTLPGCYLTDNGRTSICEKAMYNDTYANDDELNTHLRKKSTSSSSNSSCNNYGDRTLRSKVRDQWKHLNLFRYSFDMSSIGPQKTPISTDTINDSKEETHNKNERKNKTDKAEKSRNSRLQIPFMINPRRSTVSPVQINKEAATNVHRVDNGPSLNKEESQQQNTDTSWKSQTKKLINKRMKQYRKPSSQWGTFLNVFADVLRFKKNKSKEWFQLGGHKGTFREGFRNASLLKAFNENEMQQYISMQCDIISNIIPKYYGKVIDQEDNKEFIELEDLLANFKDPSVMDVKVGVRTYLECEIGENDKVHKPREDLYQKMICIDQDEPTEEEHSAKAITKLRYMVWRENLSSTVQLGFRIEAIKKSHDNTLKQFQRSKTRNDITTHLRYFVNNSLTITESFLKRLQVIRQTLCDSLYFKTHEFIGSSLLFVYDKHGAGIWLIDFAKTVALPPNVNTTHLTNWTLHSHEDGYLLGLDNLISILKVLRSELSVVRECDL